MLTWTFITKHKAGKEMGCFYPKCPSTKLSIFNTTSTVHFDFSTERDYDVRPSIISSSSGA